MYRLLFELNRLVPNGMPGGVRGGRNFPLLDWGKIEDNNMVKKCDYVVINVI